VKEPTVWEIIDDVIRREGPNYTNRAADRGGPTKFGITLKTLQSRKPGATADDVRALTEREARQIYIDDYVERPGFNSLPDPLRPLLVDFGVTSGPGRAIRALQIAVGSTADGIMGPDTRQKLATYDSKDVYASVLRQYIGHFVSVVLNDKKILAFRKDHDDTQIENLRGWLNRASEFIR
jgi:lysozyme family protein